MLVEDNSALPCPFCGAVATLNKRDNGYTEVGCQQCYVWTSSTHDDSCIDVWNHRAIPSRKVSAESGGRAFPNLGDGETWDGMWLRDYFAAKAMHAELNTAGMCEDAAVALNEAATDAHRSVEQQIAYNAYLLADMMIAQRGCAAIKKATS